MAISIKNVTIDPPLALAPMVGLSHSALRSLVLQLGGVGLLYTEMLSAKRLPTENPEVSPYLKRDTQERPLFYQIYTNEHYDIDKAVEKIELLDAQGIDINLGCPAPQLRKIGAGRFLLNNKSAVKKIFKRLDDITDLPLSVKIRIGEDDNSQKLIESCKFFEDSGVDLITVHARLYGEKFCRKPRWHVLADVIPVLHVPVVVNGGIFSVDDARECLQQSGGAGLMIGRGAVYRPWIVAEIAKNVFGMEIGNGLPSKEMIYFAFISLLENRFRPERRLGRLKQFTHYYAQNFVFGHAFASQIQGSKTFKQAIDRAEEFFKHEK